MKIETRNKRISELYKTTNFSMNDLSKRYNITSSTIKNILLSEIGLKEIEKIKKIRKQKIAEKLKDNYIKGLWQKK